MKLVTVNVSYPDYGIEEDFARSWGVEWRHAECSDDRAIQVAAAGAEVLIVALQPVTERLLAGLPQCRVVGRLGVGLDTIDVSAATRRGVAVINVPDYCTEEVATHALSLLLALARKVRQADDLVRQGDWADWGRLEPIRPLSALTLGIVGFGRIGQQVARSLKPLVRAVVATDPGQTVSPDPDVSLVSFSELLDKADLITLHAALTSETHHLFNEATFQQIRPGAILVNVSRGGLLDEGAAVDALKTGRLGGLGVDVLNKEPPEGGHPFLDLPNVLVTNHIAWYSDASIVRQRMLLLTRIRDYIEHRAVPSLVNPEVLGMGHWAG